VSERTIIIATIARPTGTTGVQTHFNAFLSYLESQGIRARLVTSFSWHRWLASPVFALRKVLGRLNPAFDVWWYETWHYVFLKLALKKVLESEPDVVIYAQSPLSAMAALRVRTDSAQAVTMVVHYNDSQAEEWVAQVGLKRSGRVYQGILKREAEVLPLLDGLVFVSNYGKNHVQQVIPDTKSVRTIVLPNFVPNAVEDDREGIRGDLITIGTLEPRKNQAYLLKVLAEAKSMGRRYDLTVVGDGPDREKLEATAVQLGVRDQVTFLGFQPQARRLLRGKKIYVHSAQMENFGLTLIEAMSAGLPLLTGAVGGSVDALTDGVEGWFWDLNDPTDGARKVIDLLETPGVRDRMADAARARFASEYETHRVAGRLAAFLLDETMQRTTS
jgi:glycosyltransferase involved in cell wall biosynthesis